MSTLAKYPTATTFTIYTLGVFLGLIHIFLGIVALTPSISQDYHRELKINFNNYAKSLTFIHEFVDRVTLALYLRYFIAFCQIVFGSLLVENGHFKTFFGSVGNIALIGLNAALLMFQLAIHSSIERIAPNLVFILLLITRLIIVEQNLKKGKVGVKTRNAGKPKTSTPKKNKNE